METSYANPIWDPRGRGYGPKVYTTSARPEPYRGYLIYNRIPGYSGGGVWDIVKDGICVSQCAGPNGARYAVDTIIQEISMKLNNELPRNAGRYVNMKAGRKASKRMGWLSDTNLSVKNISPFFQVRSTVKAESSILYRERKMKHVLVAKRAFCKTLKIGLTAKQIQEMPYTKIREMGMVVLAKTKKNTCAVCGGLVDNLLEGHFISTRLYHHLCAAKEADQKAKRSKQIIILLKMRNQKRKSHE